MSKWVGRSKMAQKIRHYALMASCDIAVIKELVELVQQLKIKFGSTKNASTIKKFVFLTKKMKIVIPDLGLGSK